MKEPFLKMFVNALTKAGLEAPRAFSTQGDPDPSEMAWDLLGRPDLDQTPYNLIEGPNVCAICQFTQALRVVILATMATPQCCLSGIDATSFLDGDEANL